MKMRMDFVTNSSSSSFVVSKDDVTREKMLEIILEIANVEREYEVYTLNDMTIDGLCDVYCLEEGTKEEPYIENAYSLLEEPIVTYNNHFIVHNDGCSGRYAWGNIDFVLDKYFISYEYGYCD